MPGGLIGEIAGRVIAEIVVYGIGYWTGFVVLSVLSFGRLRMAPLTTLGEKNRGKTRWYQLDWSPWLDRPRQKKVLKADWVLMVGLAIWIGAAVGFYFWRQSGTEERLSEAMFPLTASLQKAPEAAGWADGRVEVFSPEQA